MSYFEEVYLKRINYYGTTLQERIINKKEHDFNKFVERSPNKVKAFIKNIKFEGVLQSKTYNEIETIDYFLTYKTIEIHTGDILKILEINHPDKFNYWIVIARDNFVSAGYYRYTVVKLDREIRWLTDDGLLYKALAHISGSGSGGTNRRLISSTKITNESVVYMPNQVLTLVMQDTPEIKRSIRINIKGIVWKVSGYDNVTNEGVSYVTLEQDYTDDNIDEIRPTNKENDIEKQYGDRLYPEGVANGVDFKEWDFCSTLSENNNDTIIIQGNTAIDFYATYYNKPTTYPIVVSSENINKLKYINRTLIPVGLEPGETVKIKVILEDSPEFFKEFTVQFEETAQDFIVEGAARMKCGIPATFSSNDRFDITDVTITVQPTAREEAQGIEPHEESLLPKRCVISNEKEYNPTEEEVWLKSYGYDITIYEVLKEVKIHCKKRKEEQEEQENEETVTLVVQVESPWIGG